MRVFSFVFFGVLLAQVYVFQTIPLGSQPEQTSVSNGTALLWNWTSFFVAAYSGWHWSKLALRIWMQKFNPAKLDRYRHWGMEREALGDPGYLGLMAVITTLWGSFAIWVLVWHIEPSTASMELEPRAIAVGFAMYFFLPAYFVMNDHWQDERRRERLDALHPAFHARFPVSEILSMDECLRLAPYIFWEEYTSLPESRINKATNEEFRHRVAPYQASSGMVNQRMMLTLAVVAVLVTVPSLVYLILEGTLSEWFSDTFLAPPLE